MKRRLVWAVIMMGFSGIVAQIVLLRELMVAFHGNELSIGVILANWLLLEAAGARFPGKGISSADVNPGLFIIVTVLFSLFFPVAVYAARVFRDFAMIMPGVGLGLAPVFYLSFLILLPVSLLHGALFTLGCRLYHSFSSHYYIEGGISIARVYIWETAGTIAGGLVLTFLFIPAHHSFETSLIIALLNFMVCAAMLNPFGSGQGYTINRVAWSGLIFLSGITLWLLAGSGADMIHRHSIKKQWGNQNIVHYQNSYYGNIAVTEREGEFTFYSDGIPVITSPNPDLVFVEEFVHLPLLSHYSPERILILSGGAGGVINEMLKHDVNIIDYAEIDPLIPEIIEKFPTPLTKSELGSPRVRIMHTDARFFLKRTTDMYDIILSGFTDQSTLQSNRFFTREFLEMADKKLNEDGVLVLAVPGSLTYLSPEMASLNAMILNTLNLVFPFVRVIPGDGTNLFFATRSENVIKTGVAEMTERSRTRDLDLKLISPAYLDYRLDERWLDWFMSGIEGYEGIINEDFKPLGVFYSLLYWNEKFSPSFNRFFRKSEKLSINILAGFFLIILLLNLVFFWRSKRPLKPALTICILSTGFAGMIIDLLIIFTFQVLFGYIFYWLGLLVTAFMAGVMCGGLWMTAWLKRSRNALSALIRIEALIILLALIMPWIFIKAAPLLVNPLFDYLLRIMFLLFSVCSGVLVGAAFPLANNEYMKVSPDVGSTAGVLYSADLWGGWIGGIVGGVVLIPVLGIVETSIVVIMFKFVSLVLMLFSIRR